MSLHDNRQQFPPSPYRPIVNTLGTIAVIQALVIAGAILAIIVKDTTC